MLRPTFRTSFTPIRAAACLSPQFSKSLFSTSISKFNEIKQSSSSPPPSSSSSSSSPKQKKPLSRIAIGGTVTEEQKVKNSSIEFAGWKAVGLFFVTGSVIYFFFTREKKKLEIQREAEANRGYGKPLVGGPFSLIDENGEKFTEQNLKGKFSIIYFGFTHCPDICPDELDKLGVWLDKLKKQGIEIQPIFITCDPARDTPEVIKDYLSDFHPSIIGLTGTYEGVKNACKQYRVYFSTPPNVKPGQDYLVDHSIFFYLMDSEGEFVDALGRNYDNETGPEKIKEQVENFVSKADREKRKGKWYSFLFE